MRTAKYTVIYDTGVSRHKLLKLMLRSDGSYFATCPYHRSDRVLLSKRTINYANPQRRSGDQPLELAVLEDDAHRLKLSHHPDGFVQFSGNGIKSGRNPDGSPKGIGIVSFPLARPTAGPAFGLTVINPTAFREAGPSRLTDIVFAQSELFMAKEDNGLIVESYYFAPEWRRFVKLRGGLPTISLRHPSGALLELRVCPPPGNDWQTGFLGIDLWPAPVRLGRGDSGFAMSSPTGKLRYNDHGELEAEALAATFPALPDNVLVVPVALAFPPREDPSYRKGQLGPSEDDLTQAVRLGRRVLGVPSPARAQDSGPAGTNSGPTGESPP